MKRLVNFLKDVLTFVVMVLFFVSYIFIVPISNNIKKSKERKKEKLHYVEFYDIAKVVKKKYVPAYTKHNIFLGDEYYGEEYYVILNYKGWKCVIKGKKEFERLVEQDQILVRGYIVYNKKGKVCKVHIKEIIANMN